MWKRKQLSIYSIETTMTQLHLKKKKRLYIYLLLDKSQFIFKMLAIFSDS